MDGDWNEILRQTLERYHEPLLRTVTQNLCKPRNQWPRDELIQRSVETVQNPAVVDRRLKSISESGRVLMSLIGRSQQPRWAVGNLVEMLVALEHADGLEPVVELLQAGLLYPDGAASKIADFEQWLTQTEPSLLRVFAHPVVARRSLGHEWDCPDLPETVAIPDVSIHEADGLEWPLRLAVLWQHAAEMSFRRTQNGDFFKRDLQRLQADPLLTAPIPESQSEVIEPGFLAVEWAKSLGLLREQDGELQAGTFSEEWDAKLPVVMRCLWTSFLSVKEWNAENGHEPERESQPFASAYMLAVLVLANTPAKEFISPKNVAKWVMSRHPFWQSRDADAKTVLRFLWNIAYPLRLLQAAKMRDKWYVRLSPLGRWLFGLSDAEPAFPSFPQTLLVQPNLEILAYRQGMTPAIAGRLSRLAKWKQIGGACTLQLEPESVYRALEYGETFESIVQLLEGHGMNAIPETVRESLRTWAKKRDRIHVYPKAAVLEFGSEDELSDALSRGVQAVRLTDRLAVAPSESLIDYRHFSLRGSRDYALPPEPCIEVDDDGVTLHVDAMKSDLLLEPEITRFAEPLSEKGARRVYLITPASLAAGRKNGINAETLERWFYARTGGPMPASVRLLLTAKDQPSPSVRRLLVLAVADEETADGLKQWPETCDLVGERLGPTMLAVDEENLETLRERLQRLQVELK